MKYTKKLVTTLAYDRGFSLRRGGKGGWYVKLLAKDWGGGSTYQPTLTAMAEWLQRQPIQGKLDLKEAQ